MSESIANFAKKYDIKPLRKYGQNFIFDYSLCEKIVRSSPINNDSIALEIGPGIGGLTRAIIEAKPKFLTIIETDSRCISLLKDLTSLCKTNINIIEGDALEFDIQSLLNNSSEKIDIISNLPYNIGTELLIKWLKSYESIKSITIMLQREVVNRICAKPDSKEYGRLSVISQLLCKVEKCFDVSPKAFYPEPKVHSAIVKLVPINSNISSELIEQIESVTKLAFGQRRKMLKSTLGTIHGSSDLFHELNINMSLRPENLKPIDYLAISKYLLDRNS